MGGREGRKKEKGGGEGRRGGRGRGVQGHWINSATFLADTGGIY